MLLQLLCVNNRGPLVANHGPWGGRGGTAECLEAFLLTIHHQLAICASMYLKLLAVKLPTAATVKAESPAAERNKVPILEVLQSYLSPQSTKGTLLELASGSGQHASFFASQYPHLTYQPSDYTGELFGSISAWCEGVPNVRPPILIDASQPGQWQAVLSQAGAPEHLDAMLCVNMTHISPWEATQGLLQGAGGRHGQKLGLGFVGWEVRSCPAPPCATSQRSCALCDLPLKFLSSRCLAHAHSQAPEAPRVPVHLWTIQEGWAAHHRQQCSL